MVKDVIKFINIVEVINNTPGEINNILLLNFDRASPEFKIGNFII